MIVTGALTGPIVKSSGVTENGLAATAGVGSSSIVEQVTSGVGVSGMLVGCVTVGVSTGVDEPHADRRNPKQRRKAVIQIVFARIKFLRCLSYLAVVSFSSSKDVIHEMRLMKSARDVLCERKARTAGPTGSSPAAPPGTSAYAP